jgi:hypothetical protein
VRAIIALAVGALSLAGLFGVVSMGAADAAAGDFTVSPTTVDFGTVAVGSTASRVVTVKNVSMTTQTPNFAGGAPNDPTNFDGSQNCAGVPLAAGATCEFTYEFKPTTAGPKTSQTTIDIDNQAFALTFSGTGTTTTTTTTTTSTTTTTRPATTTRPSGTQPPATQPASTTLGGLTGAQATVTTANVAAGHSQTALGRGFQPGEVISATQQPDKLDLGSQTAAADGVVEFSWTVPESTPPGTYQFVATGAKSGSVSAAFTVVAAEPADSDSGTSPWVIALIAALVVLIIAGIAFLVYRRTRSTSAPTDTTPTGTTPPTPG